MKYYIENEYLKVGINSFGGALTSIFDKKNNEEMLYQPIMNSWQGQDVVIFPFVGRLKNKEYTVDGKKYNMESHGLLRYDKLQLHKHLIDCLELNYHSDAQTLEKYPFEFDFIVRYTLNKNAIEVKYIITNPSNNDIYYGVGGHPAFICDGVLSECEFDISGNKVLLNCDDVNKVVLNKEGTFMNSIVPYNNYEFALTKDLFKKEKTIILNSNSLRDITLLRTNGRKVQIKMYDNKYVAVWSDEGFGNYCALEPWWSLPDFEDNELELSKKKTIICQPKNSVKEYRYDIVIA